MAGWFSWADSFVLSLHMGFAAGVADVGGLEVGGWLSAAVFCAFLGHGTQKCSPLPSACFGGDFDIFAKVSKPNREQSMVDYSPSSHADLTRRQAVAALAAGFAVAVRPILPVFFCSVKRRFSVPA